MSKRAYSRRSGWSMVETLIVLAITGILATTSYAYMVSARPHAELERASLMVHGVLSEARSKAISEELVTTVVFDAQAAQLWVEWTDPDSGSTESLPTRTLPETVSFDDSGIPYIDGELSFTPRGSLVSGGSPAAGGVIVLVSTMDETFTFTANVATGRFPLVGGHLR